ncbi:MAG: cytochrome C554 [Candidatus Aminicenantes bacterium]|nr:MAG: cytochrome C554 [Candidatus Aminicenantes bacterium]
MSLVVLSFLISLFGQEFTYVGADKCKICHKTEKQGKQFPIWDGSKHSQAFKPLTSEEVKAENPDAPENPACLKCHAPLFEKAPELKEEGITCELCHGPGSAYKKLSVMKSRETSVKNGLIVYESTEAIKKQCLTCHENAHEKPFDFEVSWEKIKHPVPEKE